MLNMNINELYQDNPQNKIELLNSKVPVGTLDKALKSDSKREAWAELPLKANNVNSPFYSENDIKDNLAKLENNLCKEQSAIDRKNSMVLAASGMTAQDFSNMKDNGFSPEHLDSEEFVTLADKFRIELAKGGADISMMGGIKSTSLEAMEYAGIDRQAIENALKKAQEITDIDDSTKEFLIKNRLEPTIENVHRASFSVSSKYNYNVNMDTALKDSDFDKLRPQAEEIIRESGYPVNDKTVGAAKWLLSRGLSLTSESFSSFMELTDNGLIKEDNEIIKTIQDTVREGKAPENANILENTGNRQIAEAALKNIENITDIKLRNAVYHRDGLSLSSISSQSDQLDTTLEMDLDSKQEYELVSARRNLEEIRLAMTFEVSFSMARRGINVNTASLSNLVDGLRARENQLYNILLGQEGNSTFSMPEKIDIYNETNMAVNSLKTAPAAILGGFGVINTASMITIRALCVRAESLGKNAVESYENLMTAPRTDLGDSIKKAFRNIDDILVDLGFENSESNKRAVRILGYNSLSITRESVVNIKRADEILQNSLKALTPSTVAKLIKDGENPLDLSLEDLNEKLSEIKTKDSNEDNEGYAEFLYKLDKRAELTNEERNAYIGIYRLVNQVIKTDGAAIGFLLNQGSEVTMRNLMMAMKSRKHTNREITVDDSFLGKESFDLKGLSIINQIEMAFQTERMYSVKESISPHKLADIGEDTYMDMSPDKLAKALEENAEPQMENFEYAKEQLNNIQRAVNSDAGVYEMLKRFDLPISPSNLETMSAFLMNRNGLYKRIFKSEEDGKSNNTDSERLLDDITRRFTESLNDPKAINNAQEYLENKAENMLQSMLLYGNIDHARFISMRSGIRQVQMLGKIARDRENYTVPITIAGESGSLNLRVIRGKENKGIVEIAFNMEITGAVMASFRADGDNMYGNITAARGDTLDTLRQNEDILVKELSHISGMEISIEYREEIRLTETQIYEDRKSDFEAAQEKSAVTTARLYSVAKSFVDILSKIQL